jgi:hypothetical protein
MFTVSEAAGAMLAQLLTSQKAPEDTAIRLVSEGAGIAMVPDTKGEGDTALDHEGRTILLLDDQMSALLTEVALDVVDEKLVLTQTKDDA